MNALTRRFDGRTVAIVGAGGYLGAALAASLAASAARLLLVGRRPVTCGPRSHVLTADVHHPACWDVIVGSADIVFFVAGNSSVHLAASDAGRSLQANVLPLEHLAAAGRRARRRIRIVHASSTRVYGNIAAVPVHEDGAVPVTPFGLLSLMAEDVLQAALRDTSLERVSLRLGNVYGPSPGDSVSGKVVLNTIARLALEGRDLPLYGGGMHLRDHIFIDDVVSAFLTAAVEPDLTGAFNVATGVSVTMRDAFQLIAARAGRLTGRRSRIVDTPWPDGQSAVECRDFRADISRFTSRTGWKPHTSLQDGLDRLMLAQFQKAKVGESVRS